MTGIVVGVPSILYALPAVAVAMFSVNNRHPSTPPPRRQRSRARQLGNQEFAGSLPLVPPPQPAMEEQPSVEHTLDDAREIMSY
jgi:hypothetical protein